MLVVDLGKWMNKILIDWGIDPKVADRFDETIIALLMIAIAIGLNYLCQAILIGGMKQYTRRKPHLWNTLLMKRKVFHNLIHTIRLFWFMLCCQWLLFVARIYCLFPRKLVPFTSSFLCCWQLMGFC